MIQHTITRVLNSKGIAVTNNRIYLLKLLVLNKQKLVRLRDILKISGGTLHRITTYRTLITFCDAGLVYKIIDNNNRPVYAVDNSLWVNKDQSGQHYKEYYYFQCISCKKAICVPHHFQTIKLPAGFVKAEASLLLLGYCAKCSTRVLHKKKKKANRIWISMPFLIYAKAGCRKAGYIQMNMKPGSTAIFTNAENNMLNL